MSNLKESEMVFACQKETGPLCTEGMEQVARSLLLRTSNQPLAQVRRLSMSLLDRYGV